MNRTIKTVLFWLFLGISAMLLWQVVRASPEGASQEISYSRFMSEVEAGNVESVTIDGQQIRGPYRDGKGAFRLTGPSSPGVYLDTLERKNVDIRFRETQSGSLPMQLLGTWAPLILLGVLWFYMIRQMQRRKPNPPGGMPPGGGQFRALRRTAVRACWTLAKSNDPSDLSYAQTNLSFCRGKCRISLSRFANRILRPGI